MSATNMKMTAIVIAVSLIIVVSVLVYRKNSEENYAAALGTNYSQQSPRSKGGSCFSGDSIITMGDGSFKRISEVKVGDHVMSGKSKDSVKVIALFTELIDKDKLFGMNGIAPFATTDHCFLTPSHKFSCIDTEFVIQKEHKNEKDVVKLEERTELLMKHVPVFVHNITYQDMTMFNVYNILTEDGSYVVNDFSVSDGFPDIYSHPIVAQGIITILLSLEEEELDTYNRENTIELFSRYKNNISFDTDVSPSLENAISTFFELTQKHKNYIKIAYDLWRESFHEIYKLVNIPEETAVHTDSSKQSVSVI